MAAYGALVSLSHLLHQILHPPPLYSNIIIIDIEQIELLQVKIELLIGFLQTYPSRSSQEIAELEARIRDAAYAAEDIIESDVIDQIHASDLYRRVELETSTPSSLTKKISTLLSQKRKTLILSGISTQGIERVVEQFVSIEKDLSKMRVVGEVQLKSSAAAIPPPSGGKISMVGFDGHLLQIMSELASDESGLRVVPITGMGGIGKTTLATSVYNDLYIVEHFHVRAWVTVSQEYDVQELIFCLLSEINKSIHDKQETSNVEAGLIMYKKLFHRKYLIVMDDMWDIEAWYEVKRFLPDNENGSRVLVTSRLSNLADDFGSCSPYKMDFLDEGQSWDLFCKTTFAGRDCPVELEEIGKYIVERCRGLPLSLVLIGGVLAKSEMTTEHWEDFARDLTSALNFGNDEQVTKILLSSYTYLPVYLKPCFLYLAMFPEDHEIHASTLIRLWIAEGLVKATQDKFLEEIAHDYLEDLVSRNLILVGERGSMGNVRSCKLHDLVRDLCIAQAEKEKFVCNANLDSANISSIIKIARRLSASATTRPVGVMIEALQPASLNRSWLRLGESIKNKSFLNMINSFGLLKVAHEDDDSHVIKLLNFSNLRYVYTVSTIPVFPMPLCWNLQTLVLCGQEGMPDLPPEIWLMPQLRHLKISSFTLPDPPDDDENVIVLENLQTIKGVVEFKCSERIRERIPNLKKLRAEYFTETGTSYLHNLAHFEKLESLLLVSFIWPTTALPISLKKLILCFCGIPWEDFSVLAGSLPNLEVLKLKYHATKGEEWNPIEGQFCRLKLLFIWRSELKFWGAENYHFPCLERLILKEVPLGMIPISFSEILTLQQIDLQDVNDSMWTSARELSNEREQLGYEPLLLQHHQY